MRDARKARHRRPHRHRVLVATRSTGARSRAHIQAVRTDAAGAFRLRSLPPGDYLVVVSDDVEQGEWFDPAYLEQARTGAKHVSIAEGEKKTIDLKGPS